MRRAQRGASLLIPVLLLITVAAFAVIVAASQAGGDIQGSDANADSIQALYLAETGLEVALKRFATGTACGAALAGTITDLSQIGLGTSAYQISIANGLTTDFDGTTALPATQCRVPVTGTVISGATSRTIQAVVDRNLLEGPVNPGFDNPLAGTPPSGWTAQNPANAYAPQGGATGTAPNCLRSAWTARNQPGAAANDRRATGTAAVNFTIAASTTTVTFNRRVITRAVDCGANLPGAGPATLPVACGAALESTVCFQLIGTGGTSTVASNAGTAGAGIAACPSTFTPCTTNYQAGAPTTKVTLNVVMPAGTVSQFIYYLQLQNAGRKELFVDLIEVTNPTAIGAAQVRVWRDCSTASCP